jgi:hypothetical protein
MIRASFLFLMLGLACVLPVASAQAANDPFTVSGVPVDASGPSVAVAQNTAINAGRGRAWTILYRRLTKQQDWARQPALDETTLQRMIRTYLPFNERRSTTRYVASMTYVFSADAVKRLLRSQNIAYVDIDAKPVLVVAMAPNYSPHSAWGSIWANPKYAHGAVPIVLPIGDALDMDALGRINFANTQWPDVEPAASRVHATDAFLVQATPGPGTITVAVRRVGPGPSPTIPNVVVPVKKGESAGQAYGAAADEAAATILDVWKAHSAIDFTKRYKLTADLRMNSITDWGDVQQRLATIPAVADVSVLAMDTGEARLSITYVGTVDQLRDLAAQANLDLSNTDGEWRLALLSGQPASSP